MRKHTSASWSTTTLSSSLGRPRARRAARRARRGLRAPARASASTTTGRPVPGRGVEQARSVLGARRVPARRPAPARGARARRPLGGRGDRDGALEPRRELAKRPACGARAPRAGGAPVLRVDGERPSRRGSSGSRRRPRRSRPRALPSLAPPGAGSDAGASGARSGGARPRRRADRPSPSPPRGPPREAVGHLPPPSPTHWRPPRHARGARRPGRSARRRARVASATSSTLSSSTRRAPRADPPRARCRGRLRSRPSRSATAPPPRAAWARQIRRGARGELLGRLRPSAGEIERGPQVANACSSSASSCRTPRARRFFSSLIATLTGARGAAGPRRSVRTAGKHGSFPSGRSARPMVRAPPPRRRSVVKAESVVPRGAPPRPSLGVARNVGETLAVCAPTVRRWPAGDEAVRRARLGRWSRRGRERTDPARDARLEHAASGPTW